MSVKLNTLRKFLETSGTGRIYLGVAVFSTV